MDDSKSTAGLHMTDQLALLRRADRRPQRIVRLQHRLDFVEQRGRGSNSIRQRFHILGIFNKHQCVQVQLLPGRQRTDHASANRTAAVSRESRPVID